MRVKKGETLDLGWSKAGDSRKDEGDVKDRAGDDLSLTAVMLSGGR